MTAQEIADRLRLSEKGITARRVQKAQALAARSLVSWPDVLALMPAKVKTKIAKLVA